MTYDEAAVILRGIKMIAEDGDLVGGDTGEYLYWHRGQEVDLDGRFTVQQLEAIVVYVKGSVL